MFMRKICTSELRLVVFGHSPRRRKQSDNARLNEILFNELPSDTQTHTQLKTNAKQAKCYTKLFVRIKINNSVSVELFS